MTYDELTRLAVAMALCLFAYFMWPSDAQGAEHRLYVGVNWTHLSNLDAGPPANYDYEDTADHVGLDMEYQYGVFYFGVSLGDTQSKDGWDCSGCSVNTILRMGVRWRVL
jgi:hypothetical protein